MHKFYIEMDIHRDWDGVRFDCPTCGLRMIRPEVSRTHVRAVYEISFFCIGCNRCAYLQISEFALTYEYRSFLLNLIEDVIEQGFPIGEEYDLEELELELETKYGTDKLAS